MEADWLSVRLQCEAETRSSVFRCYRQTSSPAHSGITVFLRLYIGNEIFFFFEIFLKMITGFNQTVPV